MEARGCSCTVFVKKLFPFQETRRYKSDHLAWVWNWLHTASCILHTAFCVLRSAFCVSDVWAPSTDGENTHHSFVRGICRNCKGRTVDCQSAMRWGLVWNTRYGFVREGTKGLCPASRGRVCTFWCENTCLGRWRGGALQETAPPWMVIVSSKLFLLTASTHASRLTLPHT